jgi:hypothetical protein
MATPKALSFSFSLLVLPFGLGRSSISLIGLSREKDQLDKKTNLALYSPL